MSNKDLNQVLGSVLVVGGGIAGMAAAIRLREEGVAVTLVDNDPGWRADGTGITLSILTWRALYVLGFGSEVIAAGHVHSGVALNDADGHLIRQVDDGQPFAKDVPTEGGILRPVLHHSMSARVKALDTDVRLGLSVDSYAQDAGGVDVVFTDGSSERFDLVIGADGLFSRMRQLTFEDAVKPAFTGQACWRVECPLPKEWDCGQMFLGPDVKVGFTPCAPDLMYMYLLEHVPGNPWRERSKLEDILKNLLDGFGGEVKRLRESIDGETEIIYRPLETVWLDHDWYAGRVVLMGDAVHATTPHLGSGAGLAVEDALVLVDELKASRDVNAALKSFMARRKERAGRVVGNSLRMGEMEMNGEPAADQAVLMQESMALIGEMY